MRLFGSFLVLAEVSFALMPFMRAQKDLRLAAFFGLFFASFAETGRLMFFPCLRNERLPPSLRPPSGFWPSLRVHAGVFGALRDIRKVCRLYLIDRRRDLPNTCRRHVFWPQVYL